MVLNQCYNGVTMVILNHLDGEFDPHYAGIYRAYVHLEPLRLVYKSYCNGARVVLQWSYMVFEWCCNSVRVVLQWCYSGVTVVPI
jgi:hypothetical protein